MRQRQANLSFMISLLQIFINDDDNTSGYHEQNKVNSIYVDEYTQNNFMIDQQYNKYENNFEFYEKSIKTLYNNSMLYCQ